MNIGGNIGAALGSKKERRAYDDAQKLMKTLGKEAQVTQDKIDPWNKYRSGYADQLHGILQGTEDWKTDPGYQFRMQESQQAVERSAMAKGYGMSGNLAAAVQQRSQDVASAEYGNIISRLTGLSAATPENAMAGGAAYGNIKTAAITGQAQARIGEGAAAARGTTAWGNAVSNTAKLIASIFTGGGMGAGQAMGGEDQSVQYNSGGGQNSLTSGGSGWGDGTGYSSNDLTKFFGS